MARCQKHSFACECRESLVKRLIYLHLFEAPCEEVKKEADLIARKLYGFNGVQQIKLNSTKKETK